MSRSPYHSPNGEAGRLHSSNLNAAAVPFFMPFMPVTSWGAVSPSASPQSALRPSAPAFVAPIATMATPQSSDEQVTEISGASSMEQSLNNEGSASIDEDAAGELNCDFTKFDFGDGGFMDFDQFGLDQVTDDILGLGCATLDPNLNDGFTVQHQETDSHAAAAASMCDIVNQHTQVPRHAAVHNAIPVQHAQVDHHADGFINDMATQQPHTSDSPTVTDAMVAQPPHPTRDATPVGEMPMEHGSAAYNAASLDEHICTQDLEPAHDTTMNGDTSVKHPQAAHDAVMTGDEFVPHAPPVFHNAAADRDVPMQHSQVTRRASSIGHMAVQHIQTSSPMYRPEQAQWTGDASVMGHHYLQPSIEDDFDLTFATATGAYDFDHSEYPTPPLSYGVSSPEDDVRTDSEDDDATVDGEYVEDVDAEGETDDEYHPAMDAVTPSTNINKKASKAAVASNKKNNRSAAKKVTEEAVPVIEEVPESTFAVKQRKANVVIAKQNAQLTLARKLGQHVRIAYTPNGIDISGVYWKAPANDYSIPSTLPEKFACVQAIIAAIRNNQDCKEVETTVSFINRWAANATYFSPEEIECAAWKIVNTMIDIHTVGWTKQIFDPKLREQCQKSMFCTFEERFDELVDLFKHSKRTCIDVLKEERFYTAIGNPWELNTRSSSNKISNKTKGTNLKEVTKTKRKADEMEGGEQTEAEIEARPKKVAKRSARK